MSQQLLEVLLQVLNTPRMFPAPKALLHPKAPYDVLACCISEAMTSLRRVAPPPKSLEGDDSGYTPSEGAIGPRIPLKHPETDLKEALESRSVLTSEQVLERYSLYSRLLKDSELSDKERKELESFGDFWKERETLLTHIQATSVARTEVLLGRAEPVRGEEALKSEGESKLEADPLTLRLKDVAERESDLVAQEALTALKKDVKAFHLKKLFRSYPRLETNNIDELLIHAEKEARNLVRLEEQMKECIEALGNRQAVNETESLIDRFRLGAKLQRKLKLDDFLIAYVRGDLAECRGCNRHLSEEEARRLHNEIGQLLLVGTARQRLERYSIALRNYQNALKSRSTDVDLLNEYAQNILNEITATRHYKIEEHPEYLLFEYKRHIALRKEQVEGLNELLTTGGPGKVLQLIMGGGKTDVMAVLLAIKKANGRALSMMMVPEELMPDFSKNIEKQGRIFRNVVRRLDWSDVSVKNLQRIHDQLLEIADERKVLIATDVEIKRFLLSAQKALLEAGENEAELKLFRAIKQIFKKRTALTIDEIHKQNSRHDCRITVGAGEKIHAEDLQISVMLYDHLMHSPEISEKVYFEFNSTTRSPRAEPFTPAFFKTIRDPLLEGIFTKLSEKIEGLGSVWRDQRGDIMHFLSDRTVGLPEFLRALPDQEFAKRLSRVLCFLKGQLEILPETLSKRVNERYGIFPSVDGEVSSLAGPFKNARTPNLGSEFGNHIEWINYTIQANAKEISLASFKKEIERMQALRQVEIDSNVPLEESAAVREYRLLVGDVFAASHPLTHKKILDKALQEQLAALNLDKDFRLRFIERYILPTIQPQTNVLVCDAQNLFGAFHHVTGYTGTPKEELSLKFDVKKAPGTDGQVISLIEKNSKNDRIIVRETESAETQLRTILSRTDKERFHALIDAGALFKDLPPLKVAEIILEIRTDLQHVTYYEESPQGPVEKMLKRGRVGDIPPRRGR